MPNPPSNPQSASASNDFESEQPIREQARGQTNSQANKPFIQPTASSVNYNESFSVDYNPDPDFQGDNGDIPHSPTVNPLDEKRV